MRRGSLIRRINRIARTQGVKPIYTEGGSHTHVAVGGRRITIPRHNEVNENTARGILRYLEGDQR